MSSSLTPQQFVERWQNTALSERQSYQAHFIDVCRMLGFETPGGSGIDSKDNRFAFEYGMKKDSGGQGFADVFYEGHFAIEYKGAGKYKNLNEAYNQLKQYRENLNNPPLLIVCDIENWEIHTNFNNAANVTHSFKNADIIQPRIQRILRALYEDPYRLHPNRTAAQVTIDAADVFKSIANHMRDWKADPQRIAHFLTKLVFCLFAEDTGLLPVGLSGYGLFTEIVRQARQKPSQFQPYMQALFKAMADGGDVLMQEVPWFNGALFSDVTAEPLVLEAIGELERACNLDWSSIEPSIFGTLFERSLDPSKRAQLGAHYTSREDILRIVEPVLMQPLRREWETIRAEAAQARAQLDAATTAKDKARHETALKTLREQMLKRLREIRVLDPACGSGNFLYVALQLLLDMEKAVITDPLFAGTTMPLPEVDPKQLYGIEKDEIAHDLASIVVWIGYLQWQQNNGYLRDRRPILEDLHDNIQQKDAIIQFTSPLDPLSSQYTSPPDPLSSQYTSPPGPLSSQYTSPSDPLSTRGEGEEEEQGLRDAPPELWAKLKPLAREMRHEATPAEDVLWEAIRNRKVNGAKFRRQHVIERFIVDFYCAEARLIIEVDGPIHDYTPEEDAIRQEFLEAQGFRVLRFKNDDVMGNLAGVVAQIGEATSLPGQYTSPPGPLSMHGEGEKDSDSPSPRVARGLGGEVSEPDWPEVDVIVGNPPFLGGNKIRAELGDEYVDTLFRLYEGRVPAFADLVCYWFEKARAQIAAGKAKRAGLLATNSIRGGASRRVLERIKESGDIFMAWSDREWVLDGAAVRVSMVGFTGFTSPPNPLSTRGEGEQKTLDGLPVQVINADLTASVDITKARHLVENENISFQGPSPKGSFDIPPEIALQMLKSVNPSGKSNSEVVKPVLNAADIVRNSRNYWTIDFGPYTSLEEAQQYLEPFEYVKQHVYPERVKNNRAAYREKWWIYAEARVGMRDALKGLGRYIATPRVAKHRLFIRVEEKVLANDAIIVFAREDDYFFGVLHSKLHEVWALRMGTWLGKGNDPRYTPTTTFETFPFPWPPGKEDVNSPAYQAISAAAKCLHEERTAWLNPTSPSNPSSGNLPHPPTPSSGNLPHPPTPSPHVERGSGISERELKKRTLTNLYNAVVKFRETGIPAEPGDFAARLAGLHDTLDQAVCDAYGWPHDILQDEEEILRRLLALNLARASTSPPGPHSTRGEGEEEGDIFR
jgi:very-short-patch-repair endonuclease